MVENKTYISNQNERARIFITGGSGFIGQHLVRHLAEQGHDLLLLTNSRQVPSVGRAEVITGNLANIKDLEQAIESFKPDAAIHLAWQGIPDYGIQQSLANLFQGISLMQTLANVGCNHVLYTGSLWEYAANEGKVAEDSPLSNDNPFKAAKNALNMIAQHIAAEAGITFVWTRLFYVYGPGQKASSLLPNLIRAARSGETLPIRNPFSKHDFVYVGDVANALSLLVNSEKTGTYNVGSGDLTPIYKLVNTTLEELNLESPFAKLADDGSKGISADLTRIIGAVGWEPKVDLLDGIRYMLDSTKEK